MRCRREPRQRLVSSEEAVDTVNVAASYRWIDAAGKNGVK